MTHDEIKFLLTQIPVTIKLVSGENIKLSRREFSGGISPDGSTLITWDRHNRFHFIQTSNIAAIEGAGVKGSGSAPRGKQRPAA